VFPFSGSAATASVKETQTFEEKIDELPEETENAQPLVREDHLQGMA